ncbi:sulfotransferase domain-containing protein [Actinomadura algeriensis]|uniref:Sulfotransferase domain-containing protein n=1 Tax=Actinomadura algeriensis TaxID=1679523 RepID=A0ABR9JJE0_9ACTN|nr:sulfotransferase domain-containing protein [Actinomadura algeriensis]MBE1530661.1 hypothetical protein [Actinomadura algeriensis]
MRRITWITSCRQMGCEVAQALLAGHLLDVPPDDVSMETLLDTVPDLFTLFEWGRTVPLDETMPHAVKTTYMPGEEVFEPYRAATGKIVYVARSPRAMIADAVHGRRAAPADRVPLAGRLFSDLDGIRRFGEGRGTWRQHAREWTSPDRARAHFPNLEDICVVRFEDLRDDPAGTLHQIVRFLDPDGRVDGDRIARAARNWTIEKVLGTRLTERRPGIRALRGTSSRPRLKTPGEARSAADFEQDIETAYRRCLQEDEEFAALVQTLGYK